MTEHIHDWTPSEKMRVYVCKGCGATGFRPPEGGEIRPHKKSVAKKLERDTARPKASSYGVHAREKKGPWSK